MYDICGARSDDKVLNCPFGSPAVQVLVAFAAHSTRISLFIALPILLPIWGCKLTELSN